ncbi:MAG: 30S ribosomal protein S21 [Holosporales bacterium]|jgi:small subunit ribosomal protein S21|nr:30S ribosomal protein S21 [Holosporales bacterium]
MEVSINDNNVDHALRALKRKMQREGVYKDMKIHCHYEKPSEKKARKRMEALRRVKKLNRRNNSTEMTRGRSLTRSY